MTTFPLASRDRSSRLFVRYLGVYLLCLSTVVRLVYLYRGKPEQPLVVALLVLYGLLLVLQTPLTRGRVWRAWAYLALETGLVVTLQLVPPGEEIVSVLFVPLSLQAVLLFGRRIGLLWIAFFVVAIADPVINGFPSASVGVVMVLIYGLLYFMFAHFAHLIRTAEAAERENQHMIAELTAAHRRLQDYATEMEEFAAARERQRLARELHDSATQTIFSMNLAVQTARLLFERDPSRVAAQLDRLRDLSASALAEIRALVDRPVLPSSSPEDLPTSLRRLILERELRDGLSVDFHVTGDRPLPPSVVDGLSRIAREALNNVAKHSGTLEATLRLDLAAPRPSLEVVDHGVGFDPNALPRRGEHVGLSGMVERARELGWVLHCESRLGQGTRIRVEEASP